MEWMNEIESFIHAIVHLHMKNDSIFTDLRLLMLR